MVMAAELRVRICRAIEEMGKATVNNEEARDYCLRQITRAFMRSHLNVDVVRDMHNKINNTIINFENLTNAQEIVQEIIFTELCKMLDPPPVNSSSCFVPGKGKTSVIMFVGLRGSGKTTTCTKYANYYQKNKGLKAGLVVCPDTFTDCAAAFDQLKQNATKANIPVYGSYMESDPVTIAVEGVEKFKEENCNLIILDATWRHKQEAGPWWYEQEAALFEQLRQISDATKPDLVIFVIDTSIGQSDFYQAQAFTQSVAVGAVIIITKVDDGHAIGGDSFNVVAATKSPVIFVGTGEHMDEFEVFQVKPFVSRLLSMGDSSMFVDTYHEVNIPMDQPPDPFEFFFEQANLLLESEENHIIGSWDPRVLLPPPLPKPK